MTRPLPIVADTPSLDPGLGFETYAEALAEAVCGGLPAQFTVGIYGPWGSGKSSLLNAIRRQLETRPNVRTVFFDAWRFERSEHIIVPLLHRIHAVIDAGPADPEVKKRLRTALLSVIRSVTFSLGPVSMDLSKIDPGTDEPTEQQKLAELDVAFLKPFDDMQAIAGALDGQRIVVLIDDLDRCSPGNVVALLEAINLVLDVPGFVFVLALDYEVLVNAVSVKYPHVSGHVFIEKMVQVPFRVPRLELTQATFLDDLVPNWTMQHAGSVPMGFADVAYEVSTLGLGANPRQIKRFINSTLVLLRVAEQKALSVDPDLLAGVVGLQLKWPGEYQDFADAVMNDDRSPVSGLVEADEPELQRYAKRFFQIDMTSAELRPVVNLTHAVGPSEAASAYSDSSVAPSTPVPGGATALREINRQRVVDALAANGFGQLRPNSEAYYLADRPNLRIKIGKTVVRFEERDIEGEWRLGVSKLLTQDVEYTLALIADPARLAQDVRAGVTKYFSPDTFTAI